MSKKELLERIETLERQVCWLQTEVAGLKNYKGVQFIPYPTEPRYKPPTYLDPPIITCNTIAGE